MVAGGLQCTEDASPAVQILAAGKRCSTVVWASEWRGLNVAAAQKMKRGGSMSQCNEHTHCHHREHSTEQDGRLRFVYANFVLNREHQYPERGLITPWVSLEPFAGIRLAW